MSRFAPLSQGVRVGTIMGLHTPAELADLLRAKDYEHAQIQSAADANAAAIAAHDPTWASDWSAFLARYNAAKAIVIARDDSVTAEGSWKDILHALTADPTRPYADTDEQGLFVRLRRIGVSPSISNVPQPSAGDVDLGIYRNADDLIKAGTQGASQASDDLGKIFTHPAVLGGGFLLLAGIFFLRSRGRAA